MGKAAASGTARVMGAEEDRIGADDPIALGELGNSVLRRFVVDVHCYALTDCIADAIWIVMEVEALGILDARRVAARMLEAKGYVVSSGPYAEELREPPLAVELFRMGVPSLFNAGMMMR